MKKIIISLAFIVSSIFSYAQYINYGLRLNAGYASLGENHKGISTETGLYFNLDLKDRAGLGAEILLGSRFGSYTTDLDESITQTSNVRISSLNIPVYVYFPFSKNLVLEIGGIVSSSGSAKEIIKFSGTGNDDIERDGTYSPNGGLFLGLKYRPSKKIELGLLYMSSTAEEADSQDPSSEGTTSTNFSKSSMIQLKFGYLINW